MSYVPPYRRRPNLMGNVSTPQKVVQASKQEHREQFPCLRDTSGNIVQAKPIAQPTVNWKTITYDVTELPRATAEDPDDGWVNLAKYNATPDTALTTKHLLACAEGLELNWRRYYSERDLPIPLWITNNPYNKYEDFDRTIPYASDDQPESDSESSVYDEEEYSSDHSM
jgi:hypothetical protein